MCIDMCAGTCTGTRENKGTGMCTRICTTMRVSMWINICITNLNAYSMYKDASIGIRICVNIGMYNRVSMCVNMVGTSVAESLCTDMHMFIDMYMGIGACTACGKTVVQACMCTDKWAAIHGRPFMQACVGRHTCA